MLVVLRIWLGTIQTLPGQCTQASSPGALWKLAAPFVAFEEPYAHLPEPDVLSALQQRRILILAWQENHSYAHTLII